MLPTLILPCGSLHGKRALRARQLEPREINHAGQWQIRRTRGPASLLEWRASWAVFANAMVMIGAASPGALAKYMRGIEMLPLRFPTSWADIMHTEELFISEQWDLLLEEGLGLNILVQDLRVWNEVIALSAYGGFAGPRA